MLLLSFLSVDVVPSKGRPEDHCISGGQQPRVCCVGGSQLSLSHKCTVLQATALASFEALCCSLARDAHA